MFLRALRSIMIGSLFGGAAYGVFASLVTTFPTMQNEDYSDAFSDVLNRCRLSVETDKPLDTAGYRQAKEYPQTLKFDPAKQQVWAIDGTDFLLLSGKWKWNKGREVYGCDLRIRPETLLVETTQASIVSRFLIEQERLIAAGSHEIRTLDRAYPLILHGFGPKIKSKNNCPFLYMFGWKPDRSTFTLWLGERCES